MINGLSQSELQSLILSVGTHRDRRRLSPMEVAALLHRAKEAGTSVRDLSDSLNISEIQVSRFVRLFNLEPKLRDLADWGKGNGATIPFSSLLEIAGLEPSQQVEVATSALAHNMTKEEFRQIFQIARRSGLNIADSIASVLERRPVVRTQFVLIGAIRQGDLQDHLETLLQDSRDRLFQAAIDGLARPSRGIRGRLGPRTFTMLASQDLVSLLDMDPDSIEEFINERLSLLVSPK